MIRSPRRLRHPARTLLLTSLAIAASTAAPLASAARFQGCDADDGNALLRCAPMAGHVSDGTPPNAGAPAYSNDFLSFGAGSWTAGSHAALFGHFAQSFGDFNAVFGSSASSRQGYSAAFGALATADGVGATAVGHDSKAFGPNAVAVGSGASTEGSSGRDHIAIGANARAGSAGGDAAIALGGYAKADRDGIAIGFGAHARASGSVAIGRLSIADEENTVSMGNDSTKRRVVNVADARLGAGSSDAVTGRQLHATNQEVTTTTSIANAAKTTADTALARIGLVNDLVSQASPDAPVRLGGGSAGSVVDVSSRSNANRRITGVAEGALGSTSNEAVTGRQLHASNQLLDSHGQVLMAHGQTLAVHGLQLQAHDRRISDNRRDVDQLLADMEAFDPDLEGLVKFSADRSSIDADGARLQGVAAGDISVAGGTDAVNAGQLFDTNQRVEHIEQQGRFVSIGSDALSTPARAGQLGVAIGDGAVASPADEGATAIGAFANASGRNSVALGRASYVQAGAEDGFALGGRSEVAARAGVALGADSRVLDAATNGVAVGNQSIASAADTVSFGNTELQRRLVNIGAGTQQSDAANVGQLGGAVAVFGAGAAIDASGHIIAPTYRLQGGEQHTVGDALSTLDGALDAQGGRVQRMESTFHSVFQDVPGLSADRPGQLNLAGAHGMVLGNLAAGRVGAGSRDAVNGGQLYEMRQQIDGRIDGLEQRIQQPVAAARGAQDDARDASSEPPQPLVAQPPTSDPGQMPSPRQDAPATVDARQLDDLLERANRYTDQAAAGFERRLEKMDRRFNRMAAMNTAQSAMAMNTAGLATYNRLGAGIGQAEGEAAMAVGYQRVLNDRGSSTVSLHGAFTNSGERGVGVGVGIGW